MNFLFHRPTPWESDIQCSTKTLAQLFSEDGHQVAYLQSNIHLGHYFLRKGYYKTWKLGQRFDNDVWVTGALSIFPNFDLFRQPSTRMSEWHYRTSIPSIRQCYNKSGYGPVDMIWTTIPGSSALSSHFPNAKVIFHVIDNYSAYQGEAVKQVEIDDYKKADLIFVIGHAIKELITLEYGVDERKVHVLGQGVNHDFYTGVEERPKEYFGLKGPIGLWAGRIGKLDLQLLRATCEHMKKRKGVIVLIGPAASWLDDVLKDYDNLVYLGSRNAAELPAYLKYADFGLMLYDQSKDKIAIYDGQNPLKLYEYAAAGLPIISTPHREYDFLKPPITVVHKPSDIPSAIDDIIENGNLYGERLLGFAKNHSWIKVKEKAIKAIDELES